MLALTLLLTGTLMMHASYADEVTVPGANANGRVGALMPYTRYDSETARLGGGATLVKSTNWKRMDIATQASKQSYIELPSNGSYAEWTMKTSANGVTLRFTLPDTSNGMGQNGSLDVYINDKKVQTVDLTSYYMWQYFSGGHPSDSNDGGPGCFAFDETHFLLNKPLHPNDRIRIQSSGAKGLKYGVDFIETEIVPEEIERPAGAVSVTDSKYKQYVHGKDYLKAFEEALKDADAGSKKLYIPAGTYELSGIWYMFGSDVKITGAGIWYTNLKFTNPNKSGGGISGGNGKHGPDDYCKNMDISNFYINSSLRSRYNQEAVYKCFMDVFKGGSAIHDIWEDHFECGFWIADYNGTIDYSNNLKIYNCRIRNNFADGVNFCQGTSNATVYNCSIRNNGDDGLAMWNDDYLGAHDEKNNTFAYNTIEFIWRAGGIAIYGGDGHKVYNNYLADMFMASGIHLNDNFRGPKFQATQNISFDNNVLVRCGTNDDSWHEDLAAVDVRGGVRNVTFNNTKIYDSPFDAIRIIKGPTDIVFKNTEILGASLAGQTTKYSTWEHSTGAIRLENDNVKFIDGLKIANVSSDKVGNNQTWPLWTDNNKDRAKAVNYDYLTDVSYKVPEAPEADKNQGGGLVDPMEGITNYDIMLKGLRWENANGNTNLKEGDQVTFKTAVVSNKNIPAGVSIGVRVTVDGKDSYISTNYKNGLKANQPIIITTNTTWTAQAGGHTIVAEVDYRNYLTDDINKDNNLRTKRFNVLESADDKGSFTPVTGGYDLVVTKILMNKKSIKPGDRVNFSAYVANAGDQDAPAGQQLGVEFIIDNNTDVITWSDNYTQGVRSHAFAKVTANGGQQGNEWVATPGKHTVTAWIDNYNGRYAGEINHDNNKFTIELNIPLEEIRFITNPDQPDDLGDGKNTNTAIEYISVRPQTKDEHYYDLQGHRYGTTTEGLKKGIYIHNGKKIVVM